MAALARPGLFRYGDTSLTITVFLPAGRAGPHGVISMTSLLAIPVSLQNYVATSCKTKAYCSYQSVFSTGLLAVPVYLQYQSVSSTGLSALLV